MALTQSARPAGPSWEEEVVPALRKRLESESRTLARRLSAISLSSVEEAANAVYGGTYKQSPPPSTSSHPSYSSGGQRNQAAYHQQYPSDRTTTTATNGSSYPASGKSTPRTRTYSTPYGSDLPNGLVNGNGNARPKYTATKSSDPVHSFSPRPVDVKPTRIPKVSRTPTSPYTNGYGQSHSPPVTVSDLQEYGVLQQRTGVPSSSTRSTIDIPRTTGSRTGLLNETAPFPTDLTMSSGFSREEPIDDPPRASMESEERPFEHWYRGEVSRNGGVGELRVGRRQEMLDIANYGHLIGNKKPTPRAPPPPDTSGYRRKRAGSIAGMTNKERERGSLYLDDEHANQIGRVLDENPLTDLEDGDEVSVVDSYYHHDEENTDTINEGGGAYAYIPEVDDGQSYTAGAYESNRSTTPTPLHPHSGRPSSRQQSLNQTPTQGPPPTRIPGPASRRSSESRSTMNTTTSHAVGRTPSSSPQMQHQQTASTSSRTSPSPNNLSASRSNTPSSRQQQQRGVSPAPAKSKTTSPPTSTSKIRTPVPKPKMKAKTPPKKVDPKSKEKRESVGQYPMPQGLEDDEEGDMADAIPTWTQPVKGEGNWDEMVLPVVARKKGLDEYYETADGSPQPKKPEKMVAPAPGTFGFDHTKYRPPRNDDDFIPMDEFGRPADDPRQTHPPTQDEQDVEDDTNTQHSELPSRQDGMPVRAGAPSPAPFSHYAPTQVRVGSLQPPNGHDKDVEKMEDENGAGCCKCVIM